MPWAVTSQALYPFAGDLPFQHRHDFNWALGFGQQLV